MRVLLALVLSIFLSSCALQKNAKQTMEERFGMEVYEVDLVYRESPWYKSDPEQYFFVSDDQLYLQALDEQDRVRVKKLFISKCPGLYEAILDLKVAVSRSVDAMFGIKVMPQLPITVLDDHWHSIKVFHDTLGSIELRDNSRNMYVVPWIEAAKKIFDVTASCKSVAST